MIEDIVNIFLIDHLLNIHGSECGRNRPGFGWHAVSQKLRAIQYNIINLKKDITEKVLLVVLHGLTTIDEILFSIDFSRCCICVR